MNIKNIKKNEEYIVDELIKHMDEQGYSKQEQIFFLKNLLSVERAGNKISYSLSKISTKLAPPLATLPIIATYIASSQKLNNAFVTISFASLGIIAYFAAKTYYTEKIYNNLQKLKNKQTSFEKVLEYEKQIIKEQEQFNSYNNF